MIDQFSPGRERPPESHRISPEDGLSQIAPALRELAAGVKSVPQEIKSELGKQTFIADTAYKAGWKDGAVSASLIILLVFMGLCFLGWATQPKER